MATKNSNNSYANELVKFKDFFTEKRQYIASEIQEDRIAGLKKLYFYVFLLISLVVGAVVYVYYYNVIQLHYNTHKQCLNLDLYNHCHNSADDVILWILAVYFCVYHIFATIAEYKSETKYKILEQILSYWGAFDYFTDVANVHRPQALVKSSLFPIVTHSENDDCFDGYYKDNRVSVSELVLSYKDKKMIIPHKVFGGILISFSLYKKFKGETVISERDNFSLGLKFRKIKRFFLEYPQLLISASLVFIVTLLYKYTPIINEPLFKIWGGLLIVSFLSFCLAIKKYMWLKKKAKNRINSNLKVWNKNRHLLLYSSDLEETKELLTPDLIKAIENIKYNFEGYKFSCVFKDNQVLIAIHTYKDMFEVASLFSSTFDYKKIQDVFHQFYDIFALLKMFENKMKNYKESGVMSLMVSDYQKGNHLS